MLALVLIVGIGGIAGLYASSMFQALDAVHRDDSMMPAEGPAATGTPSANDPDALPPISYHGKPPVNIVLMGSDSRGSDRGRSDVLQLVHIPGNRDAVYLLSFPRDSWVDIPGHGKGKINWAYAFGGSALTVSTLNQMLTVPMDHAVSTDFDGFKNVIDALGGVTVRDRQASDEVTLNGEEALAFVRERYTLAGGDFDRAQRQRDVIAAIADKLTSSGTLTSPSKFNEAVTTLGSQFTVDSGFTNRAIVDLGMESAAAFDNVRSLALPNLGTGTVGKQSIVKVDWAGVHDLRVALRTDTMDAFYAQHGAK